MNVEIVGHFPAFVIKWIFSQIVTNMPRVCEIMNEMINSGKGGFFSERADTFVISSNRQT